MTRFPLMPLIALTATAALAAPVLAAPVLAAPASSDQGLRVPVRYGDLNMASPEGAKTLYRRIEVAADTVCGGEPDSRDLARRAVFQACRKATIDKTVAAVSVPDLTAMAHPAQPISVAAR